MIHVIAIITAKPGLRDEIIARIIDNIPAVKAEDGCIEYRPIIDLSPDAESSFGRDTVVIVENWEDEVCLKKHAASPHMKRYAENVKVFIQKRDVRIMKDA
ncbi:MAG: putative quinol monooxygenase [Pantoea sp.]|uniref:putative quinol monooxygenase n=1 Tax=Pantoea sp. TaxID=69393 RepID=UPI0039E4697A